MADAKVADGTQLTNMPLTGKLYVDDSGVDKYANFSNLTETGTFTPTIYGATTPGVQTYSNQLGEYCRVGKMVQFRIFLQMTAKDAATNGTLRVGALPYNTASGQHTAISVAYISGFTITSNYFMNGYIQGTNNYIVIQESNGTIRNSLSDTALTSASTIMIAGTYQAA